MIPISIIPLGVLKTSICHMGTPADLHNSKIKQGEGYVVVDLKALSYMTASNSLGMSISNPATKEATNIALSHVTMLSAAVNDRQ